MSVVSIKKHPERSARMSRGIGAFVAVVLLSALFFPELTVTACAETGAVSCYDVTTYSSENGVPTGEANAVAQTPDGYLWVGGYGGLLRYDGLTFEQFSGTDTGLTSYSIRTLWVSREGILWVGSNDQGPFYYDGKEFHGFSMEEGLSWPSIRSFCEDTRGRIWIGAGDGLRVIENGAVRYVDFSDFGHDNSTIYTLSLGNNGLIWGVDYAGALFAVDPENGTMPYYLQPGQYWDERLYAYSAVAASDGSVYAGTNSSVLLRLSVSGGTVSCEEIPAGTLLGVNALTECSDGTIWAGADQGMGFYRAGTFTELSYLEGMEHIYGMCEDYEHTIWAASGKRGVLKIHATKVGSLPEAEELKEAEIYAIHEAADRIYVGSENGVVVMDKDYHVLENLASEELRGIQVHAISSDSSGRIYIGTYYNGLFLYDPRENSLETVELGASKIRTIQPLSDSSMAVGSNAGLDILVNGEVTQSYHNGETVLCMLEQSDGSVLLGTDGKGIRLLKDGAITPYAGVESGLSGGVILRMKPDIREEGTLFVSCGYDVFHGNAGSFSRCADLSAYSGSALDLFSDGDNLWILKSCGILCVPREVLLQNGKPSPEVIDYYGIADGLPGTVVANSWSTFQNGLLSVCTTNGVGLLDTRNISLNSVTPKGTISAITFSDGSVWDGSSQLTLDADLTRITFSMAALTYAGEDPSISYYLEGLEEEPVTVPVSEQHTAEYTNLKAGDYRFHFQVYNGDGVPGEEQIISLEKKPKFTETAWPYVLAVFLTAALAYVIGYRRRRDALQKQKLYKDMTDQMIATISGAVDAKDPYTCGHSRRVADFSVKLGKKLGLGNDELERLNYVALLHDIGKIGVPDDILKKPSRLTDQEFNEIKRHVEVGGEILSNFTVLPGAAEGALYHHERYGGGGYGKGLSGTDIPLFARIIGVADAYDAMSSSRCYRTALPEEVVISELQKGKGTQFDPEIADLAVQLIREEDTQTKNKTVEAPASDTNPENGNPTA